MPVVGFSDWKNTTEFIVALGVFMEICLLLSILLILAGIICPDNYAVAFMQYIWIVLVISFNFGGMDFGGNEFIYDNSEYIYEMQSDFGLSEFLSVYLAIAFKSVDFAYWEYNAMLTAVILSVSFLYLLRNVKNPSLFFSFFMVYPLIYIVIQKRFAIATFFCIIAFLFLQKDRKLLFLLFVFIASGFHISALFLLPFLFYKIKLLKNLFVIVLALVIEVIGVFIFNDVILMTIADDSMKALDYMAPDISFGAGLFFVSLQVSSILFINKIISCKDLGSKKNKEKEFICKINIFSLFYIPLLMLNSVFFRYYRIIMLLSYIFVVDEAYGNKKWLIRAYILCIAVYVAILITFGHFGWEEHLETLFKYNKILTYGEGLL